MEYTQKEVLEALEESGRTGWTTRQMTALRSEGFLPKLTDKRKPGINKARYVWTEEDLELIVDVYDWWEYCGGDRATLALILWLEGYEISPNLLRGVYIPIIEAFLHKLTRGETNPDDILDVVSEKVVIWMRKMKYTPGLAKQRKKMETEQNFSMKQMETLTETVLSALAVPEQELDVERLYTSLSGTNEEQDDSTDYNVDDDFLTQSQNIQVILRDILTLPHMLDAIRTASSEQWQQARNDFLSICHIFGVLEKRRPKDKEVNWPEGFLMNLKVMGAGWLIAPLLSTRFHGYGQWIDDAFENFYEFLADPAVQEQILARATARGIIEEDVQDGEKPDLLLSE